MRRARPGAEEGVGGTAALTGVDGRMKERSGDGGRRRIGSGGSRRSDSGGRRSAGGGRRRSAGCERHGSGSHGRRRSGARAPRRRNAVSGGRRRGSGGTTLSAGCRRRRRSCGSGNSGKRPGSRRSVSGKSGCSARRRSGGGARRRSGGDGRAPRRRRTRASVSPRCSARFNSRPKFSPARTAFAGWVGTINGGRHSDLTGDGGEQSMDAKADAAAGCSVGSTICPGRPGRGARKRAQVRARERRASQGM